MPEIPRTVYAFPWVVPNTEMCPGMDLRDYFAGLALLHSDAACAGRPAEVARKSYAIADAMMAERNRER